MEYYKWSDDFQYIGWYDDDSVGGIENSVAKMLEADPNFGEYKNHHMDRMDILLFHVHVYYSHWALVSVISGTYKLGHLKTSG